MTKRNQPFTILVANAKGGCGKTTIATNLAAYYASQEQPVTLMDLDPQQSSSYWLKQRATDAAKVTSLPTSWETSLSSALLSKSLADAQNTLIIDPPLGLDSHSLNQLLRVSQVVLVPVLPSDIDIHAVTRFLQTAMLTPSYRQRPKRLAVIANRAKVNTRIYAKLELFLSSLNIPFLATLRDTQHYVDAFGQGLGINELEDCDTTNDSNNWKAIVEWIELQKRLRVSLPGL